MAGRFFDFDEARATRQAAPAPTMRVFGETVDLPRSVPAAIHLTAARRGVSTPVTLELLIELLGYLVGPDTVDRWMTDHPDLEEDDVAQLYYGAMSAIQERDETDTVEEAPDEGEAQPPATGDPGSDGTTSQLTGVPSKPTSNGSTTSTPPVPSGTT